VKTFEKFSKPTLAELEREAVLLLEFLEPQAVRHRVELVMA
jgi:hypothetical protein